MADGAVTTPGSTGGKTPAIKDKECPYCHQAFTSSSLGRHLDLYIKEKNAKPPDDLHNVEEIRRTRGNVTRRQARSSTGKREGSTASSTKPTPFRDQRSPSIQGGFTGTFNHSDTGPIKTYINRANWQATGVINDLPPISTEDHSPYPRNRSPSRRTSAKEGIAHKQKMLEEQDRARAAELALQEVLQSVKAANMRAHPPSRFDFNFLSLSFPELCLQCLSAPQSLLAGPTIPDRFTWSLEVPKVAQYELLREWLDIKLKEWNRRLRSDMASSPNHQSNGTDGHQADSNGLGNEDTAYYQHLSTTYENWKALSDKQRQETWRVDCFKAFAREEEKHKATKRNLHLAEQEIQHLRYQLAQMRHPPEYSIYPPSTLPISREAVTHLPNSSAWAFDSILFKWKTRIQSSRSTQHPLPPLSPWASATPTNLNSNHTNGNLSYPQPHRGDQRPHHNADHDPESDEDEELADAPGEEDVLDQGQNQRQVLDPHLRGGGDDVGEKIDMDGERHAGGRMLMGLREYSMMGQEEEKGDD